MRRPVLLAFASLLACAIACADDESPTADSGDSASESDTSTTEDETSDTASSGDGDGDPIGDGDGEPGDGDGDVPGYYYGSCPTNQDDECMPGEFCLDQNIEEWWVCTSNCNNENECPQGPPGTDVQCISIDGNLFQKRCFLNCEGNFQCPEGMVCENENLGLDKICVYKD